MKHLSSFVYVTLALAACSEQPEPPPSAASSKGDHGYQGGNLEGNEPAPVMRVEGKTLLDSSGQPVVLRGIEGWFGPNAQQSPERMKQLVDGIASKGFNAIRLQTLTNDLSLIEPLIQYAHSKGMVFFLNDDHMPDVDQESFADYLGRQDVQDMVDRHRHNMIIDVTIEEPDDAESPGAIEAWIQAQKDSIETVRNYGYTQPLIIGTLNHGRYLRGLLDHGAEIIASDPEKSIILNAQMYWGQYSGDFSYQGLSGYDNGDEGIRQAAADVAAAPFLIQWGLDAVDDGGNFADVPYELLMSEAERYGIGTLWWQWKDPGDNDQNSLVTDSFDPDSVTALGEIVIDTHPASIRKTSRLVTDFPPSGSPPATDPDSSDDSGDDSSDDAADDSSDDSSSTDTAPADSNTPGDVPAGDSCGEVPEQFRGAGDGCDCPADGNESCDSDCNSANPGGQYCGCQYCYPAKDGEEGDSVDSTSELEDTDSDSSDGVDSDEETSVPEETTTNSESDVADSDEETSEPQETSNDSEGDVADSDEETSEPEETSNDSESTNTSSDDSEAPEEETQPEEEEEELPLIGASCSELPQDVIGADDGCDCTAVGDTTCDPDCDNGNRADQYCGCEFCHPADEPQPEEEEEEEIPLIGASCFEIPEEFIGVNDGCDCAAVGDTTCDPDCDEGNRADQECGCEFCHPED